MSIAAHERGKSLGTHGWVAWSSLKPTTTFELKLGVACRSAIRISGCPGSGRPKSASPKTGLALFR